MHVIISLKIKREIFRLNFLGTHYSQTLQKQFSGIEQRMFGNVFLEIIFEMSENFPLEGIVPAFLFTSYFLVC